MAVSPNCNCDRWAPLAVKDASPLNRMTPSMYQSPPVAAVEKTMGAALLASGAFKGWDASRLMEVMGWSTLRPFPSRRFETWTEVDGVMGDALAYIDPALMVQVPLLDRGLPPRGL